MAKQAAAANLRQHCYKACMYAFGRSGPHACSHACMPCLHSNPVPWPLIAPTSTDVRDLLDIWPFSLSHRPPQMFGIDFHICSAPFRTDLTPGFSPTFRADLHGFSLPLAGYPFGDLHECSPTFRTDLFAPASTDVRIGRRIQFKMLFAYVGVINS